MSRDYDVVIPTHGRDLALLLGAVDSVLAQTVPPQRVLVVADGAPGVAPWMHEHRPGVEVIEHDRAWGQAAARQTGMSAATATWIAFVDDDDLWSPVKQEVLFEYVEHHPGCGAVRAGYWTFASEGLDIPAVFGQVVELRGSELDELEVAARVAAPRNDLSYLEIHGASLELMLERNRGVIGTSMVLREVLARTPAVPPGLHPGDDYLLFCHVAGLTEWHLVRQRLAYYRLHGGQDSRVGGTDRALNILRAKSIAWEVDGARSRRPLSAYGGVYAAEVRGLVWVSLSQGRWRDALRVYRAGLVLLPRPWHRLLAAVPEPLAWRAGQLLGRLRRRETGQPAPTW